MPSGLRRANTDPAASLPGVSWFLEPGVAVAFGGKLRLYFEIQGSAPRRKEPPVVPLPENSSATAPKKTARPKSRTAPPTLSLSVIIVNFQRTSDTINLVEQLDRSDSLRTANAEIVLVDNDVDSQPLRTWARNRPDIAIHSFGRNRGFARAVNQGCAISHGEWLLMLNPDIGVSDEFLDRVIEIAESRAVADPNTGVIGFGLDNADGSSQPSAGWFPTLTNVLMGSIRCRAARRCRLRTTCAKEVPWVTGCCFLVRRACWQELGGFDEDYFLYYEDVDLCRRARNVGWTVWHEPSIRVKHYHPLHSRTVEPALRLITRHALLTYAAKHWRALPYHILARLIRTEARYRKMVARLRRETESIEHYGRLDRLCRDLVDGRSVRARHQLIESAVSLAGG